MIYVAFNISYSRFKEKESITSIYLDDITIDRPLTESFMSMLEDRLTKMYSSEDAVKAILGDITITILGVLPIVSDEVANQFVVCRSEDGNPEKPF